MAYRKKTSATPVRRKKYFARAKINRSKVVASKRFATRVKKVVMKVQELKYTQFVAVHTALTGVPYGDNMLSKPLADSASIFPAVGSDRHSCEGQEYYLKGLNVAFGLLCERWNCMQPITVMVVRINPRFVIVNGNVTLRSLFPMTAISGAGGLSVVIGRMEKSFGNVVKTMTIRPYVRYAPEDGLYEKSGDTTNVNLIQNFRMFKTYIPINKRITRDAETAAEIPGQLSKYALFFHVDSFGGTPASSGWQLQSVYTAAVFKDV